MNFEEQIVHRLGQKHGADFANSAASERLASLRRAFGENAETILLRMHAKTKPIAPSRYPDTSRYRS